MHIPPPPPDAPFSIELMQRQIHLTRHYTPPAKTAWFTVQPTNWFALEASVGLKPSGPLITAQRLPAAPQPDPMPSGDRSAIQPKRRPSAKSEQFVIAPVITFHF